MDDVEAKKIVELCYQGILRRPVTEKELSVYSEILMNGHMVSSILSDFVNSKEFNDLTSTKLFVPPGHFYSPIVPPEDARRHLSKMQQNPNCLPDVRIDHEGMVSLWDKLAPYITELPFRDDVVSPYRYGFNNQNFGYGDSSILFAMIRHLKPRRFIEVGSGWSSACALDTLKHFQAESCDVTFIEPYPELLKSLIGDETPSGLSIIPTAIQDAPLRVFDELSTGDILFIDSTHVVRTGSDVCHEVFEILPRLKSGVIVHFHDIFWPFEYPEHWITVDNRSWNELYVLRAFLAHNANWDVIYFNDYFAKREPDLIARSAPRILQNSGGGLWLRKK